jgi:hypothetical protein
LLVLMENGHYWISRWLKPDLVPRLEKGILAVCLIWSTLNFSAIYQKTHTPLTPDWVDYYSMAEWAKTGIPDSAIVCNRSAFLFYLKSNKRCVAFLYTLDRKKGYDHLIENHVNYVVVDHFQWSGSTQNYLVPVLNEFPDKFQLVKKLGTAELYQLKD